MAKRDKLKLEYEFRASPTILYDFLTNPSNLAQWFSDHCDVTGDRFSFFWDGHEEVAIAEERDQDEYLKWVWEEDPDKMIEFKITKADISGATILTIFETVEKSDFDEQTLLWDEQIGTLKMKCGG